LRKEDLLRLKSVIFSPIFIGTIFTLAANLGFRANIGHIPNVVSRMKYPIYCCSFYVGQKNADNNYHEYFKKLAEEYVE